MFGSDNQAGAHPAVLAAIEEANAGRAGSYGADPWTTQARALLEVVFETGGFDLHFVTTGGAANGLALSVLCPAWAAVVCHVDAHVLRDEGSGPELLTGGARLVPAGAATVKLTPADLEAVAAGHDPGFVHGPQPRVLTLTNLSETGLAYTPAEIAALTSVARAHGWTTHVDGARFANAVVATGASPADLTWRSGVDALSLGLTKTGGMMAEAVILFGAARSTAAAYQHKRAGQLLSKQRFLAAQFVALLEGGLWLDLAGHANAMAGALASVFQTAGFRLAVACRGNEVFVALPPAVAARLQTSVGPFYPWKALGPDVYRFVAAWTTTPEDVAQVQRALQSAV